MTTNETIRRARLILKDLKDLGLRPSGGILEEWMAHYVAEAIERLESEGANAEFSDECAATIAKLWELREAQKQRELTTGVNWFLRQGAHVNDAAAGELRRALELTTEEGKEAPAFDAESGVTLSQIGKLEEHALSVLWAATWHARRAANRIAQAEPRKDQDRESRIFEALEKPVLRSAQSELQKVFPDFKDMSLEDYEKVSGRIQEVLRALDRVRHRLLEAGLAADPSHVPDPGELDPQQSLLDDFTVAIDEDQSDSEGSESLE
jgi:hypothetical protein